MQALIDTHTFLWFVAGSDELSHSAKRLILDGNNAVFISIASLWEISIKTALGKLQIGGEYASVIDDVTNNDMTILPINFHHTVIQNQLPFHHRDPFDRIILAQALAENMPLISKDSVFDSYFVGTSTTRIW
jgi:PIN domain nuclease of toxin-antitoxin system